MTERQTYTFPCPYKVSPREVIDRPDTLEDWTFGRQTSAKVVESIPPMSAESLRNMLPEARVRDAINIAFGKPRNPNDEGVEL